MANQADTNSISIGPPVEMIEGVKTVAIRQVARMVTALPPHQFRSLGDALIQAKDYLGAYRLAAHSLTQQARAGELTVAVRMIWSRHAEQQLFILRRKFWQWYDIVDANPPNVARVDGPVRLLGWHFFVGRRRFDRYYSMTVPNRPAVREPSRERSQPNNKLTLLSDEPQFEPPAKWRPEQAEEWFEKIMIGHPRRSGESKNQWARRLYNDHMKPDFGDAIPWDEGTVRRRMNPWKRDQAK
jgi:hypothetical protein